MKMNMYLISFTLSGVKNLEEKIRLDFYKKTIDKNFNPEKYRIKAIYGENGSGKTAIVTGIQLLKDLVLVKRYLADSQNQQFLKEIINKKTKCIYLESELRISGSNCSICRYSVELHLKDDEISIAKETLEVKNGNYASSKYETVFSVEDGDITVLDMMEDNATYCRNKTMNLLKSQTLISSLILMEGTDDKVMMEDITFYCIDVLMCFLSILTYLDESDQHKLFMLKKYLSEVDREQNVDVSFWERLDDNLNSSVSSKRIKVKNIDRYEKRIYKLCRFLQIFKPQLKKIDIDKKEDGEYFICDLVMNYGDYRINREFESTGIKKLVRLYDCLSLASTGWIVFIDELDSNINDIYLCKLLEYFMDYGTGQLCFTTHNLDPMNILKRNKNSINFLSNVNTLYTWVSSGNASPENYYKNGMIEDSPFNIDATDFIGILGDDE